jgi:hypothetical protein
VGAEIVQGGRNSAPISGRSTTPYKRKKDTKQKKDDGPSPADGKNGGDPPKKMTEKQVRKNKEKLQRIIDSLG